MSESYRKVYVSMNEVKPGDVWEDTDPRQGGRTVEIIEVLPKADPPIAVVRLNTPARNVSRNAIGRRTRIRLDRFPVDYKLSDVEPHRFGTHIDGTRGLGYWPVSQVDPVSIGR
jgi:hypothetical protein